MIEKNHSKFLLMYHIIFICKYRKKALLGIENDLKNIIFDIASTSNFKVIEMECDKDHIHLLVRSEPNISI